MSGGKEVFHKKPLGKRWYLISSPIKGCEFSTITSGTERKRGFGGILPCLKRPFVTPFASLYLLSKTPTPQLFLFYPRPQISNLHKKASAMLLYLPASLIYPLAFLKPPSQALQYLYKQMPSPSHFSLLPPVV